MAQEELTLALDRPQPRSREDARRSCRCPGAGVRSVGAVVMWGAGQARAAGPSAHVWSGSGLKIYSSRACVPAEQPHGSALDSEGLGLYCL